METNTSIATAATSPYPAQVYLCSLCNKPFVQETSRNRHLKYCGIRQRRRPRSCRACNAAKTKCTFRTPCSRCEKKGIECVYDGLMVRTTDRPSASSVSQSATAESSLPELATPNDYDTGLLVNDLHRPCDDVGSSNLFTTTGNVQNTSLTGDHFMLPGSGLKSPSIMQPPSLDDLFACEYDGSDQLLQKIDTEALFNNYSNGKGAIWCNWMGRRDASLLVVAHSAAVTADANRLAVLRLERPHALQNADLIIQALRSLPTMMQRRESFPWFVHAHSHFTSTPGKVVLPEVLSTCMSVAQMFASRTVETRNFIWRTIRTECRCVIAEMHGMSKYEVLAATQACMIYLIMHIVDYSTEFDGHGRELIMTLQDLYHLFKVKVGDEDDLSRTFDTMPAWDQWVFIESRRRMALLWFLVGLVVYVKNGSVYDETHSYRCLLLPSSKLLWEASSRTTWERDYESSVPRQCALLTLGDLIDAQKSNSDPSSMKKLDMWNAGADNLGSLLNLVGTML